MRVDLRHFPATPGVYVIRNTVNGKCYVGGTTVSLRRRLSHHRSSLRRNQHPNGHLQAAWNKYGESAFVPEVLEVEPADVVAAEQSWLDSLQPEYNISPTAYSLSGYVFTDEQRARVSAALKGKPKSAEHRANIWATRQVTDEMREQMASNGRKGRSRSKSPEHRAKIGAQQRGDGNHRAKLTEAQVREIKTRLAAGERGRHLAAEFGVAESVVSVIKHGKSWSHVVV